MASGHLFAASPSAAKRSFRKSDLLHFLRVTSYSWAAFAVLWALSPPTDRAFKAPVMRSRSGSEWL